MELSFFSIGTIDPWSKPWTKFYRFSILNPAAGGDPSRAHYSDTPALQYSGL